MTTTSPELTTTPPNAGRRRGVPRRNFLAWSAAVGGTGALVATAANLGMPTTRARAAEGDGLADADATVQSVCVVNCGSRCPLRLQVKDGVVVRVLPDNTGDDSLLGRNIPACNRGRNMRERIYSPDRIKAPLKRKEGTARGAGEWEEISWDEALQLFADKLTYTIDTYGNAAIYSNYGSGVWNAHIANSGGWGKLFNLTGGYLGYYGNYSYANLMQASNAMFGNGEQISNSFEETTTNGQICVLWGNNPVERRMSGGGNYFTSLKMKEAGVKVIVIDPRHSDSALLLADQWIANKPGTDAALVAGLAHVMISENLHDQTFLDTYCQGFDEEHMPEGIPAGNSYRSYIMGEGPDGIEKTPQWAAEVTGVPVNTIIGLARELGSGAKVNITQGWGPQRHANGENQCRAIYTLACLVGQVGLPGGGSGGQEGYYWPITSWFDDGENPVKESISMYKWPDAIIDGPSQTATKDGVRGAERLSTSIKFMLSYGGNCLQSQSGDINRLRETLTDESLCEFIVSVDNQMTASCEISDLVLPDTTTSERTDLVPSEYTGDMAYLIAANQAIEPLYDTMSAYDMCKGIAEKLGVREEFTEGHETMADWARTMYEADAAANPEAGFPASYDDFTEQGVHRYLSPDGLTVALKDFREDPVGNALPTPSGKIEIFSTEMWEAGQTWEFPDAEPGDAVDAIPVHVDTWEGAKEALTNEQHPLQMLSHHFKGRTHSTYGNLPKNVEAHPQKIWINAEDAAARGIANGDLIDVFNDRGRIRCQSFVTQRIMPGVISVPQGAWLKLDDDGVDHGGVANMLTSWHPTPYAKGNAQMTALVQAEKAAGA